MGRMAAAASLSVVAAVSAATTAHATPSARFVYLRGKGTESCPADADVREAVQTRLGYDPFSTYAASTMFAEVSAVPNGFSANLKLVDGDNVVHGDRTLRVRGRCAELMDAMALTISIAIDPMSVTREGRPEGAPPLEREVVPTSVSAVEPAPEATTKANEPQQPHEQVHFWAGFGPLGTLGSAPSLAFGGVLFLEARYRQLLVDLEGRGDFPASGPAGGSARVESRLAAGTVMFGAREGPIFAGAVASVGRYFASSSSVVESREKEATFLAAGLRGGAAIPLGERIELALRLDILANLMRHSLLISGRSAYEFPAVMGAASVVGAVRFW